MKCEIEMEMRSCAACGVVMAANSTFFYNRREDHKEFYCLNGHSNYYPQKSDAEKLREELAQEKKKARELQIQLDKAVMPKKRGRPRKQLTPLK
jgi:hypothetical protein